MFDFLTKRPNLLDKLPRDKLLHFAIGVVVQSVVTTLSGLIVAFAITCLIGVGIEIYQYVTKSGQVESMDALAVVLGGVVVAFSSITL